MSWESFGVVGFDLMPLLQGQTRIAKLKSAYNSLIIDPRDLQCKTNYWARNLLMLDLTFGPSFIERKEVDHRNQHVFTLIEGLGHKFFVHAFQSRLFNSFTIPQDIRF